MTSGELERAVEGTEWDGEQGCSAADIERAERELGQPMPADLRTLYRWSNGGAAESVHLFDIDEMVDANRTGRESLPATGLFFASDGGDGWFFFDTSGDLGTGAGAVLWMERGWPIPDDMVPVAPAIPAFLGAALHADEANPSWDKLGSIRDQRIGAMRAALIANRGAWQGKPGVSEEQIRAAESRMNLHMPRELAALLAVSDGPRIGPLQFLPAAQMAPFPEAGGSSSIGAVHCADGDAGIRYGITLRGFLEPNGGRMLEVKSGVSPDRGVLLGPLPAVIVDLLDGKEGTLEP